jgi:CRISPR-associated exonuclease Cas4
MKPWLIPLILAALAIILLLIGLKLKNSSGLPSGRVVYADTDQLQALPKPLFDPNLKLVGKPDYVIRQRDGSLVPIDFKSMNAPTKPYDSHIYQVLAYCYLIEQTQAQKPSHGLIRYLDKSFGVPYGDEDKASFLELINTVRETENCATAPTRSHQQSARCKACGYKDICDQMLA